MDEHVGEEGYHRRQEGGEPRGEGVDDPVVRTELGRVVDQPIVHEELVVEQRHAHVRHHGEQNQEDVRPRPESGGGKEKTNGD